MELEKTASPEYITILVAYTDLKSVEEVNNKKMAKYCFRVEATAGIAKGDILKSSSYSSPMLVTDVILMNYNYYNANSGEMTKEMTSTKCYPIKTLVLREEDTSTIFASKVTE